ncbi:MAG TPA: hypothetical protein VNN72_07270, partial [Polyangiaceae bacterium]|nr:hypothetical protein [Polyangiaceae bacterium]
MSALSRVCWPFVRLVWMLLNEVGGNLSHARRAAAHPRKVTMKTSRIACPLATLGVALILPLTACSAGDELGAPPEAGALAATSESLADQCTSSLLAPDLGATQTTLAIVAQADAEVRGTDPNTNFGSATSISVKGTGSSESFAKFRFEVRDFVTITSATLTFTVTDPLPNNFGGVMKGHDSWEERPKVVSGATLWPGITYANAQGAYGQFISYFPGGTGAQTVNVSSWVNRNGVFTFDIISSSASDTLTMNSREAASGKPTLTIVGRKNPTPSACRAWANPTQIGNLLPDRSENQWSGLAASRLIPGRFYTHGDKKPIMTSGWPTFFAVSGTGVDQNAYLMADYVTGQPLTIDTKADFEEIQTGPGPFPDAASWVYLGDIGDNGRSRTNINIYRAVEPYPQETFAYLEQLKVAYPGGMMLNAEAFIIDPVTGSLFIIEKPCGGTAGGTVAGKNRIFQLGAPLPFGDGAVHTLWDTGKAIDMTNESGTVDTDSGCGPNATRGVTRQQRRATGSSASVNGDELAVTFYSRNKSWYRAANTDVATALAATGAT